MIRLFTARRRYACSVPSERISSELRFRSALMIASCTRSLVSSIVRIPAGSRPLAQRFNRGRYLVSRLFSASSSPDCAFTSSSTDESIRTSVMRELSRIILFTIPPLITTLVGKANVRRERRDESRAKSAIRAVGGEGRWVLDVPVHQKRYRFQQAMSGERFLQKRFVGPENLPQLEHDVGVAREVQDPEIRIVAAQPRGEPFPAHPRHHDIEHGERKSLSLGGQRDP